MEGEVAFWRARYLELLQNHTQIVGLLAKQDEQTQKIASLLKRAKDAATQAAAQEETAVTPAEDSKVPKAAHLPAGVRESRAEPARQASQG